jgi:hypothetical protein
MLATSPYSTWNFETKARYEIHGEYTYAGCLGLAPDKSNYIVGYMRLGHLGIAKVRDGVRTILAEQDQAGIEENKIYDVRFWHRDGLFGVEYKETSDVWCTRGSMLTYEWLAADEEIVTTDDIYHVGIYSHIDPPKFRTSGFRSTGSHIPVMPCDVDPDDAGSDFLDHFPESGQVDVDGIVYTYDVKNDFFADEEDIQGPFQLRNVLDWVDPLGRYETDLEDAFNFAGNRAIEFTKFDWLASAGNHDNFNGAIIGTSYGYGWVNDETFFKPWITTGGVIVMQRSRGRYYAENDEIPENANNSLIDRVYITNGLSTISPTEVLSDEYFHQPGSFVYIDSDDSVFLYGFAASSGNPDNSVENLLEKICRIAGTKAYFPGDDETATHTFADNGTLTL